MLRDLSAADLSTSPFLGGRAEICVAPVRSPFRSGRNLTLSTQSVPSARAVRILLVLVAGMSSLVLAIGAGALSRASGTPLAQAVLTGGGAFVVLMTLSLAVLQAIGFLS